MPLLKWRPGMSKKQREKIIYRNAVIEMKHGKKRKQAFAIAYRAAREKR